MSSKATVRSPSNIALIKYWGAKNLKQAIPVNSSISMTLDTCYSRCTVEHVDDGKSKHEIYWRPTQEASDTFAEAPPSFAARVRQHLDTLRRTTKCGGRFRVATENSFPAAAGLASSASGFSALTLATLGALELNYPVAQRSALSRLSGSGSASRSVLGGYVEWPEDGPGEGGAECYAFQLATADDWPLANIIALVQTGPKTTSSLDGHRRARSSPYWRTRQRRLPARLAAVRKAIDERDFDLLGPVVEAEAIDLHCVAMTSHPPVFYWQPATLTVLEAVRQLRSDGVAAWSTMDAGANVHIICQPDDADTVADMLGNIPSVERVIRDRVGHGPVQEETHLL